MYEPVSKEMIQEAALEVFSEKGYHETRIMDIANAANVSTAMIYKYFKGKKELFESLDHPELKELRPGFEGKRADIINCALLCFGERGFKGTTMELVAQKVGLSKAMIYQYFENKEDLFSAVMYETPFQEEQLTGKKMSNTLRDAIYKVGKSYLEMLRRPERVAFTRMVINESHTYPEIGKIYHQRGFGHVSKIMMQKLENHKDENVYKENVNLDTAARMYVGAILSYALQYYIIQGTEPMDGDEEMLQQNTDIFLAGILK